MAHARVARELHSEFESAFAGFGPEVLTVVHGFLEQESGILERIARSDGASTPPGARRVRKPGSHHPLKKPAMQATRPNHVEATPPPRGPRDPSLPLRTRAPAVVFSRTPTGRGGRIEKEKDLQGGAQSDHFSKKPARPREGNSPARGLEKEEATIELEAEVSMEVRVYTTMLFRIPMSNVNPKSNTPLSQPFPGCALYGFSNV